LQPPHHRLESIDGPAPRQHRTESSGISIQSPPAARVSSRLSVPFVDHRKMCARVRSPHTPAAHKHARTHTQHAHTIRTRACRVHMSVCGRTHSHTRTHPRARAWAAHACMHARDALLRVGAAVGVGRLQLGHSGQLAPAMRVWLRVCADGGGSAGRWAAHRSRSGWRVPVCTAESQAGSPAGPASRGEPTRRRRATG
jgi:hypothetical protein